MHSQRQNLLALDLARELDRCHVIVLGGGISGLTTALTLQALGLTVGIVSDYVANQDCPARPRPFVATDYAMASAYPHNLKVKELPRVSADSQAVFAFLEDSPASGISRYQMFEVFEHEPESAPLAGERLGFQTFDGRPNTLAGTINPPVRPGAAYLWGWVFQTYFADMPQYMPFLWQQFTNRGGKVKLATVTNELMQGLPKDKILINCLGLAARELFADKGPDNIMRGIQIIASGAPLLRGPENLPLAYNYTPPAEVFARADGHPEYVHFFARSDGWLLGQTREPGRLDENGSWIGQPVAAPDLDVAGVSVPAPIITLNQEILQNWQACSFNLEQANLIPRLGYRYYRDPENSGVRLEKEETNGRTIIHNYGHGGSGITMSWGCALACARLLRSSSDLAAPGSAGRNELFDRKLAGLL